MNGDVKIRQCGCSHKYQDEKYGHGNRVHNIGGDGKQSVKLTCTVCGTAKK